MSLRATVSSAAAAALLFASACVGHRHECRNCAAGPGPMGGPPAPAGPMQGGAAQGGPVKEENGDKVGELKIQAMLAERRMQRAEMDCEQQKRDADAAMKKAGDEVQNARDALDHFQKVEKPARLAKAELDLKGAADGMAEQQEEMQQLELMYAKDDLGDKTKEIVLLRGKRRLQRAIDYHGLAKQDFADLQSFQLPQQERKLALAVDDAQRAFESARFNGEVGRLDKETAAMSARHDHDKARHELEIANQPMSGGGGK